MLRLRRRLLLLLQLRLLLVVRKHARVLRQLRLLRLLRLLLVAMAVAKQTVFRGRLGLAIRVREQRGGVS